MKQKEIDKLYQPSIESEITGDPTLRFFLREAKVDYKNLEFQVDLQISCFKIALTRWLSKF